MTTRALLLVFAAGCLNVPSKERPACKVDSDCNGAGEVCQQNMCWGDPPMGTFAATLGPPSASTDVVQTEIPALTIPSDGWLGDVVLEAPVTLSGRVDSLAEHDAAIGAAFGTRGVSSVIDKLEVKA